MRGITHACLPAREGRVSELEAGPVPPLPWLFCSDICRSKLSSQNPSELRVSMTVGNTAGKISLVQMATPFSTLRAFLYGTFDGTMVGTSFSGNFYPS